MISIYPHCSFKDEKCFKTPETKIHGIKILILIIIPNNIYNTLGLGELNH